MKCEHEREIGDNSHWAGVLWAGPIGTCKCCRQYYGFIDSGSFGEGPDGPWSMSTVHDRDLCPNCGGMSRTVITGTLPKEMA